MYYSENTSSKFTDTPSVTAAYIRTLSRRGFATEKKQETAIKLYMDNKQMPDITYRDNLPNSLDYTQLKALINTLATYKGPKKVVIASIDILAATIEKQFKIIEFMALKGITVINAYTGQNLTAAIATTEPILCVVA